MEESILTSIKKLLGMTEEYEAFDKDIVIHINSIFTILNQMGVGPTTTFRITGKNEVWSDFIRDKDIEYVKSFVYLRVRLLFDPPASSSAIEAINKMISELEWRLYIVDNYRKDE